MRIPINAKRGLQLETMQPHTIESHRRNLSNNDNPKGSIKKNDVNKISKKFI